MAQDRSHKQDSKLGSRHASPEGQKGVPQEAVGSGRQHDPNNFANDRARAAEAGRKGGQHSHKKDDE